MKYLFYNIRNLLLKEKFIFLIMVLCVFVSSMILNFSYGFYQNYTIEKRQSAESLKEIAIEINKENAPTHRQVQDFVESLSDETTSNMFFFVAGKLSEYPSDQYNTLDSRFTYSNGKYGIKNIYIGTILLIFCLY